MITEPNFGAFLKKEELSLKLDIYTLALYLALSILFKVSKLTKQSPINSTFKRDISVGHP